MVLAEQGPQKAEVVQQGPYQSHLLRHHSSAARRKSLEEGCDSTMLTEAGWVNEEVQENMDAGEPADQRSHNPEKKT